MFKEHDVCPMLSLTLFKICPSKYIWHDLTFPVTWRHRSSNHLIAQVSFPTGALIVTESVSPAIFAMGPKDIWSRPWPFRVTWLHRSRDQSIRHMRFFIGVLLKPSSIFNRFPDIRPQNPCARRARTHTDRHTPQVIFIFSVPCNVLHWTDNEFFQLL